VDVVEVAGLFDAALVLSAPPSPETVTSLQPEEAALVARALDKRRTEFATGRALAHLALGRLGAPSTAILNDDQRAPVWPAGIRGSITHCNTRVLVAMCRDRDGSVGIDVEHRVELKRHLWESVFLEGEMADLGRLPESERGRMALVLFSAKESLYKAQFPISRTYMGFRALRVQAEAGVLTCTFQEDVLPFERGAVARGRYFVASAPSGEVLTGVHIPAV
jgi:4'-phosphopantetheinyl transferase EntD